MSEVEDQVGNINENPNRGESLRLIIGPKQKKGKIINNL